MSRYIYVYRRAPSFPGFRNSASPFISPGRLLFTMLLDRRLVAGVASLWAASTANAAPCRANLVVDNFTKWTNGANNLDWPNGGKLDLASSSLLNFAD